MFCVVKENSFPKYKGSIYKSKFCKLLYLLPTMQILMLINIKGILSLKSQPINLLCRLETFYAIFSSPLPSFFLPSSSFPSFLRVLLCNQAGVELSVPPRMPLTLWFFSIHVPKWCLFTELYKIQWMPSNIKWPIRKMWQYCIYYYYLLFKPQIHLAGWKTWYYTVISNTTVWYRHGQTIHKERQRVGEEREGEGGWQYKKKNKEK